MPADEEDEDVGWRQNIFTIVNNYNNVEEEECIDPYFCMPIDTDLLRNR